MSELNLKHLLLTIAIIASAWTLSSLGYFWSGSLLGTEIGYRDAPFFYATYYLIWSGAVFWVFYSSLVIQSHFTMTYEHSIWAVLLVIAIMGFLLLIFPRLPEMSWTYAETPVEFFYANSWYFIPKSMEIIFQQILIVVLVLSLQNFKMKLIKLSLVTAILFGTFHMTLAFAYDNPLYVIRYSIVATIFGAIVPYLILRVRNGIFISFAIHFGFYALDITLIHFYFATSSSELTG